MKRTRIWATLVALAALAAVSCGSRDVAPRLTVLITVDTLRTDRLGFYGYRDGVSPFLDSVAERSVVFERALTSMAHTAPSHASLFTGLYAHQHGLTSNGQVLPEGIETLAEIATRNGVRTAAFVVPKFLEGTRRGFEVFATAEGYSAAPVIVDKGLGWLNQLEAEDRAFLWLHFFDVHEWFVEEALPEGLVQEQVRRLDRLEQPLEFFRARGHVPETEGPDTKRFLRWMAQYDAQIRAVDRELERLWQALDARFPEQYRVVFTADHGEGLGSHRWMGHGASVYDELMSVPLLIHTPGATAGRRVDAPVGIVDLGPTLLELMGLPPLENAYGQSYAAVVRGGPEPEPGRSLFLERRPYDPERGRGWRPGEMFGVQEGGQKLFFLSTGEVELYDLAADPLEATNLFDADDRAHRDLLRTAQETLELFEAQQKRLVLNGELVGVEALKKFGYL